MKYGIEGGSCKDGAKCSEGAAWATRAAMAAIIVVATIGGLKGGGGKGPKAVPRVEPPVQEILPKASQREIREAAQALKSNKDFRNWFHREFKADQVIPKGAKTNPDLSPDQVWEAYQEWLEAGKPKAK